MKRCILLFLLFSPLLTEAQNPDLLFTGSINSLILRKTTHREIEKQFGEPDTVNYHFSSANIGACFNIRSAHLTYHSSGLNLNCISFTTRKTMKRKKILSQINYNEHSGIILNETIICGKTSKEEILKLFPENQIDENDKSVYCSSIWNGRKVAVYFNFDENDLLNKVKIE